MDLSIVIVNYNVKAFLLQCLDSIFSSQTSYAYEVIVIDNASVDGSEEAVQHAFPQVDYVRNTENIGFGKANNQGFERAKGTYTLILNPDTVLREDTLQKAMDHMKAHPEVGGLGIKGIDGSGQFLPESKRALPTPLVALWKISGLSRLFPKSKIFARYHLGHLDPDQNHEVEILVGCFMLVPTELLREVGGFDPRYFMYGEDIDLSYELLKSGHKNHYLAESQIIHYKGESTKRGSMNYVRMFYQAMIIFAKKQFSGSSAFAYTLLIYAGIYFRAALAILARLARNTFAPVLDAAVLAFALEALKTYWEANHRYVDGGEYPDLYTYYIQGSYIIIWLFGLWISGTYHKNTRPTVMVRAMAIATLGIGFLYGLLPEELRFSRALLMLGAGVGTLSLLGWRVVLGWITRRDFFEKPTLSSRLLVLASASVKSDIDRILTASNQSPAFSYTIDPNGGTASEILALAELYEATDLIVDRNSWSLGAYMDLLSAVGHRLNVRAYLPEHGLIVGSNSSVKRGEVLGQIHYHTSDPNYRRQKRIFDISSTLLLWVLSPVLLPLAALSGRAGTILLWMANSTSLLGGKQTLVGYDAELAKKFNLPEVPRPIFDIANLIPNPLRNSQTEQALITNYAKEASIAGDLLQLWQWHRKKS